MSTKQIILIVVLLCAVVGLGIYLTKRKANEDKEKKAETGEDKSTDTTDTDTAPDTASVKNFSTVFKSLKGSDGQTDIKPAAKPVIAAGTTPEQNGYTAIQVPDKRLGKESRMVQYLARQMAATGKRPWEKPTRTMPNWTPKEPSHRQKWFQDWIYKRVEMGETFASIRELLSEGGM